MRRPNRRWLPDPARRKKIWLWVYARNDRHFGGGCSLMVAHRSGTALAVNASGVMKLDFSDVRSYAQPATQIATQLGSTDKDGEGRPGVHPTDFCHYLPQPEVARYWRVRSFEKFRTV
jgi:hypothetical protein